MTELSPFRVFLPAGMEPDAGALEQMRRCMADERAVEGALMADHHLGYSMPIGGVIGYRALRLSDLQRGERIGLFGFGASAHIALQIARHWQCEAYVFTRGEAHRRLARELGAAWTGGAEETPPQLIDRAVVFAPVGALVLDALRVMRKGGTVAHAGIYSTPIPQIDYNLLYHERTIRSVANSTRKDVEELLQVAAEIPIRTEVEVFPLRDANRVLQMMKASKIRGAAALQI